MPMCLAAALKSESPKPLCHGNAQLPVGTPPVRVQPIPEAGLSRYGRLTGSGTAGFVPTVYGTVPQVSENNKSQWQGSGVVTVVPWYAGHFGKGLSIPHLDRTLDSGGEQAEDPA